VYSTYLLFPSTRMVGYISSNTRIGVTQIAIRGNIWKLNLINLNETSGLVVTSKKIFLVRSGRSRRSSWLVMCVLCASCRMAISRFYEEWLRLWGVWEKMLTRDYHLRNGTQLELCIMKSRARGHHVTAYYVTIDYSCENRKKVERRHSCH
jgi:hypothetical protein